MLMVLSLWKGPISRARPVRAADLIIEIAAKHGVSEKELVSGGAKRRLAWPRHELFYEARQRTKLSYPNLARIFGCNHATVLMGARRHAKRHSLESPR